ncbi:MAG: hypothetical protein ACC613_04220 [Synergistales bacterium]
MDETSRVDRKIPLQPVRIGTGGIGYGLRAGGETPDLENAGRIALVIRGLALAFGREIECRPEGRELLVLDKGQEVLRIPLQQALRLVEAIRDELGPILDRRA